MNLCDLLMRFISRPVPSNAPASFFGGRTALIAPAAIGSAPNAREGSTGTSGHAPKYLGALRCTPGIPRSRVPRPPPHSGGYSPSVRSSAIPSRPRPHRHGLPHQRPGICPQWFKRAEVDTYCGSRDRESLLNYRARPADQRAIRSRCPAPLTSTPRRSRCSVPLPLPCLISVPTSSAPVS